MTRQWVYRETGQTVAELGGFNIIYADPSWKYRVQGGRGAADNHYKTMSLAEQALLPVEDLAAPNCALFMWAVWPQLAEAFALMRAWRFEYKNCGFVWVKTNELQPKAFIGMGHYTRGNSEFCLLGVRGKPERLDAAISQIIAEDTVVAPVAEHSEKPAIVRDRIIQLFGDVPAIELFAREKDPRFEVWGNEVHETVTLEYREERNEDQPEQVVAGRRADDGVRTNGVTPAASR